MKMREDEAYAQLKVWAELLQGFGASNGRGASATSGGGSVVEENE